MAYHGDFDVLAYASEPTILLRALPDFESWNLQHMPAETVWVVNRRQLMNPEVYLLENIAGR